MAFPQPTMEQYQKISQVKKGNLVKVNSGEIYEFVELKQKAFLGISQKNNTPYRVAIAAFVEVVGHNEQTEAKKSQSWKKLQPGDLFWINYQNRVEVWRFKGVTPSGKLKAEHPIDSYRGVTMPLEMYGGNMKELK